ncbi:MAG TPA: hypothetical protein VFS23_08765, partial [Vicinamibacterales bacterium]|nr:hypothetical protein [Vicinamibacterales bacterium]
MKELRCGNLRGVTERRFQFLEIRDTVIGADSTTFDVKASGGLANAGRYFNGVVELNGLQRLICGWFPATQGVEIEEKNTYVGCMGGNDQIIGLDASPVQTLEKIHNRFVTGEMRDPGIGAPTEHVAHDPLPSRRTWSKCVVHRSPPTRASLDSEHVRNSE